MISFKRKDFSALDRFADTLKGSLVTDTIRGATIGAAAGTFISGARLPKHLPKFVPGSDRYDKIEAANKNGRGLTLVATTTLIGAALGALVGTVKSVTRAILRKNDMGKRLIGGIVKELKGASFREDMDFTRNPKQASQMRTRVCLVITRTADEFKIMVNMYEDPKLKTLAEKITREFKELKVNQERVTNKYNEINISTIPNPEANVKTVVDISAAFIRAGYPVYIVEVG